MNQSGRILVVQVAAMGAAQADQIGSLHGLSFSPLEPVFPALACPVQAAFRTEAMPCFHGMEGNGFFDRRLMRPFFWEPSAKLVYGRRIWDWARASGKRVGMLFWQQSLGESVDVLLFPHPIPKHGGGLMMDCVGRPADLYVRLKAALGRPFPMHRYWGPMASIASSEWMVDATIEVMRTPDLAPHLLLTYVPHLDYDLQRFGPRSPQAAHAVRETGGLLRRLVAEAERRGYEPVLFGDYAMTEVIRSPVFPNRALREAGLLTLQRVRRYTYPDFFHSRAFVLADHEIGLVYIQPGAEVRPCIDCLEAIPGVDQVLDREQQRCAGVDDPDGADLIVVPAPGGWIAYPWWEDPSEAPEYAGHVGIRQKPGFDPCELFFGVSRSRICTDPSRIRGTHGRTGPGREVAYASGMDLGSPSNVMSLAKAIQNKLERDSPRFTRVRSAQETGG